MLSAGIAGSSTLHVYAELLYCESVAACCVELPPPLEGVSVSVRGSELVAQPQTLARCGACCSTICEEYISAKLAVVTAASGMLLSDVAPTSCPPPGGCRLKCWGQTVRGDPACTPTHPKVEPAPWLQIIHAHIAWSCLQSSLQCCASKGLTSIPALISIGRITR